MARYAFTIFTSAFLLFGVQPLVGKYALPWFGGTPAVWAACMLFFQALLLAGYAYAHASATRLAPRRQAQVHLGLLAVTVGVLAVRTVWTGSPVTPGPEWRPDGTGFATGHLLAMLVATIGLPFFVLSTTGPLLQSWFSRANPGASPYRLYALSNTGSLLSLLGYPFLVEPFVSRGAQGRGWGAGFLLFAAACAVCAWPLLRSSEGPASQATSEPTSADAPEATARPGLGRTLAWVGLSGCASVLLLASTNQLSQDVAAGPFLWVLPLALYLITFIIAFERDALYSRALFTVVLIGSVGGVTHGMVQGANSMSLPLQLLAHGGALFAGCMVCHGELYRLRPAPRHLSAFYLWVSVGGMLGGVFVSFVAPHAFRTYLEYPLALAACCLVALVRALPRPEDEPLWARTTRLMRVFLLAFASVGLAVAVSDSMRNSRLAVRNFFGVVQVRELAPEDPEMHHYALRHGAIVHGVQFIQPERRLLPTAYYTPESGLGLAIAEQRRLRVATGQSPGLRVGVLGLGVGTSAALATADDTLRFYEINPAVISLARGEGGFFTYLKDTPATVEMVEGDARISLEQELARGQPQAFDVLVLDVFSSDSIPMHLLTEEAVDVYRQHLAPHGVLAMHVSNQHLDLVPIVLAHAWRFGLHTALVTTRGEGNAFTNYWALLSPDREFSHGPTFKREGERVARMSFREQPALTWTDDLSSVLSVLKRKDRPVGAVAQASAQPSPPVAGPETP
jgi:hypothetical protein